MKRLYLFRHFITLLALIVLGLFGPAAASAQDDPPPATPASPPNCAECHVNVVSLWQTSAHAQAYGNAAFQDAWHAQGEKAECLACHTTGFDARIGEYTHEGVICEACHGQTSANHPPEAAASPSIGTCAACHTTTYSEWQTSAHGQPDVACTACHQPHSGGLRLASSNELCLNCHSEEPRDDYTHLVHPDENCVDCHWFHQSPADLDAHMVSGDLYPTGHSAVVETRSCVTCHEEITENEVMQVQGDTLADMNLSSSAHPLTEANIRIQELDAKVESVEARGANRATLRLIQGAIVGLAAGGVLAMGISSYRHRGVRREKGEE